MAADTAFQTLWSALHSLRDSLRMLGLTVSQDHPPARAVPEPVRRAAEDAEDLLGLLQEAIAAVAQCVDLARWDGCVNDSVAGRGTVALRLHRCHDRLVAVGRTASTGLTSPERLDDLAAVVADRDGRWHRWHASVLDGLGRFRDALWDAHAAALTCWDDLSSTLPARQPPHAAVHAGRAAVHTKGHTEEDR